MGSLPRAKAGVGSAVNDTTRQVGGALGVAIIGSLLSTAYGSSMEAATQGLPAPAGDAARDSVGGALGVAAQLGPQRALLADTARAAFVDAMGTSVLVAAGFALAGALVALLFLPAREPAETAAETAAETEAAEPATAGTTRMVAD
jgi:hypothetical protein